MDDGDGLGRDSVRPPVDYVFLFFIFLVLVGESFREHAGPVLRSRKEILFPFV